jgi:hypothetical protein
MPFREGYGGVYDPATLARLQDILEHVWQAMVDGKTPIFSRDDLAGMIIRAYDSGMPAETIKEVLVAETDKKFEIGVDRKTIEKHQSRQLAG